MFKKFLNLKPKDKIDSDRSHPRENSKQPNGHEELPDRPFEINLDELYEYEHEDLQDFIRQYEQFFTYVRNKYNDILSENIMTKEKLILLEQERKRLLTENDQSKIYIENLKKYLDEMTPPAQSEAPSTKSSSPNKVEESTMSTTETDHNEDGVVESLKSRLEKLLLELEKAEDPICSNILVAIATKKPINDKVQEVVNNQEQAEGTTDSEPNGEEKNGSTNVDDNEALVSEGVNGGQEFNSINEVILRKALQENLGKALKHIATELTNIFDKYSESYMKAKLREKELNGIVKNETGGKVRNEEYEAEIKDAKIKLGEAKANLNEAKTELDNKVKALNQTKRTLEEVQASIQEERKGFKEALAAKQKDVDVLLNENKQLREALMEAERAIEETEVERDEIHDRLTKTQEDYQSLYSNKERTEKDVGHELVRFQQTIHELEEEKKKLEKKLSKNDNEKNDTENSLIQEKLKHHQTIADLSKAKEKLVEVEKHMNDEIEGRKGDIKKYEDLKKRFIETERKEKEYKKTIKNLSQQLVEFRDKETKELEEKAKNEANNTDQENGASSHDDETNNHRAAEKTEIINTQYTKIHQLEEKLEEASQEMNVLKRDSYQLQKDNEELRSQVKILSDKRETGLQEIKRLNRIIEGKNGGVEPNYASPHRKSIDLSASQTNLNSPATATTATLEKLPDGDNLRRLQKIKRGLDHVYKDIIMTITNEKMQESKSDKKASGKLGELVKGPLPSDNFMRIEKRMNDTIVMLQEFMEHFE